MRAYVELKIDGHPRRIEFDLPQEEAVRPGDLLPVFRQFSDAMVAAAESSATEPISCTKGCGACCRQLVPIRVMEARRLAAFVRALPEPRRCTIFERFAAAARRVREAEGMRARLDTRDSLDKAGRLALKLAYFALGIPCPFLEDESCGIYAERPMICREHLVSTPAAWCADPRAHSIRTLPMRRADIAAAKLEAQPGAPEWIPLIDLLAWVDAHPVDSAPAATPRELIGRFLRELSA